MRKLLVLLLGLGVGAGCEQKVDLDCQENPYDGRVCYQILLPVCGCNNKTYSNACEAEAYGIKHYTSGECNQ